MLSKFSTKKFDQESPNPACLRVNVDAGILGLGDVLVRVDVGTETSSVERRETELDECDESSDHHKKSDSPGDFPSSTSGEKAIRGWRIRDRRLGRQHSG